MITGRVTRTPEAIVALKVSGPQGLQIEIEAILDTGFTDYLTLPLSIVTELGLPSIDTVECQLADGRIVTMQSYQAVVQCHGLARDVLALAADGDPLLGMSLLYGSRVTIDVVADGQLRIEPMG